MVDVSYPSVQALGLVRDLFMTERTAMTLPHDDVVRRPKSAFAKAVNYLHRQWPALVLFLSRPEIELHKNRSELLLRGPVVGRKAWLFAGSPEGADASAIWFSLTASCMLQGIDPMVYLGDVLPGLGNQTKAQIRALTPSRWAAARRASVETVVVA